LSKAPRIFISYSHDNGTHKNWVLNLATRLNANGVDLVFDQWDLRLGSDLPLFMESGLSDADRVIMICSGNYVQKANEGKGGVGYEKMIMTADLLKCIDSNKIIPLIRENKSTKKTPIFLGSKVYIDFNDDDQFEKKYEELIREIHGVFVPSPKKGEEVILHLRQKLVLEEIAGRLDSGLEILRTGYPEDVYVEEIRRATLLIGSLTGEIMPEDVLSDIFSRFCVGK
jgi:tRNA U34 5-carboxymethylaminomethyl modifying GTPase MnmE/TrmE